MVVRQRTGSVSLIGPRSVNEDSIHLDDRSRETGGACALLAVADGMGGLSAGDVASQTAMEVLAGARPDALDADELLARLAMAEERINEIADTSSGAAMGTTVTVAVVVENEATIAHIGDSRAYLVHEGTVTLITEDHSRVGRLVREGVLSEVEAMHHPEQNVLERALGAGDGTPDVYRVGVGPGDILLLCTDGLHTFVTPEEMAYELEVNASVQTACERLAQMAEERGSQDNITAVAWEYPSPRPPVGLDADPSVGGRPATVVRSRAGARTSDPQRADPRLAALAAGVAGLFVVGFLIGLLLSVVL